MSDKKAVLTFPDTGKSIELAVKSGSVGPDVIDITGLYSQAGVFTYDPGFVSTASCHSTITYIDGDKGILLYRGYPIEQLAENSTFLEVAYLLLNGELPSQTELSELREHHHPPHDDQRGLLRFFDGLPLRRPSDGHDGRRGRLAVGLLSRLAGHPRPDATARSPPTA